MKITVRNGNVKYKIDESEINITYYPIYGAGNCYGWYFAPRGKKTVIIGRYSENYSYFQDIGMTGGKEVKKIDKDLHDRIIKVIQQVKKIIEEEEDEYITDEKICDIMDEFRKEGW